MYDRMRLTSPFMFRDRLHAGAVLARALDRKVDEDAVVVGLARGGVILAARVARALELPLELVAVRKVTHPLLPEYALGAVAPGAQAYVRAHNGLTDDQLATTIALAQGKARALDASCEARACNPRSPAGRHCSSTTVSRPERR